MALFLTNIIHDIILNNIQEVLTIGHLHANANAGDTVTFEPITRKILEREF